MKLHAHIKKLFDEENRWLKHEKKLAKQNQRKVRHPVPILRRIPLGLRHLYNTFGYIWWRNSRKAGTKNARGQLLPQNQTEILE